MLILICKKVSENLSETESDRENNEITVVRVIPDPNKDIGFDLISHFHLHPPVRTQTHATLADAIKSLLPEENLPDETVEILSDDLVARKMEDDLAEAHFTMPSRKEAEVNEGGLVEANVL